MDARFVQAHKEARWALWLTLLYLATWLVAAYLPLVFIVLCWAMVKFIYRDISLEDDDAA